jgi:glycosyltransferase involved in cell wall biosynthesis
MSDTPDVSVVMSVHNGARYLQGGLRSITEQQGVSMEFIIVDDGSTDETPRLLAEAAASDPRLRIVTQENTGLTRALIRGCAMARGRYIARQDGDDISMPGRLQRQCELLDANPDVVMASSWAEVLGPCDEPLLVHKRPADTDEATRLLTHGRVGPPGHGSVMFRRDAYARAGGYRDLFYYAQDSDLWLRMAMFGKLSYVQDVLYKYRISADSISGRLHPAKIPYARLITELHEARLLGQSEEPIIARANLSPATGESGSSSKDATNYFIARCLFDRRDPRALDYVRLCLAANPRNFRAWLLLPVAGVLAMFSRGKHPA